mmetsp:Transcript_30818/g.87192  ORF Transcript_30818/g.87192 Transcript_30818/m.87192 type:complete len:226 (-) Transcript_30818:275-952(-)
MEAAIRHKEQSVEVSATRVTRQHRGGAPEDLPGREGFALGHHNVWVGLRQRVAGLLHRGGELNGSRQRNPGVAREVQPHGGHKVLHIALDVHKHVHARHGGGVQRHQAAVAVVHDELRPECRRAEVVNAAGAKGDITHHQHILNSGKPSQNVCNCAAVHEQPLRKLESHGCDVVLLQPPYSLVNLKVVVRWKDSDGFVEGGVLQDVDRDRLAHKSFGCRSLLDRS